MRFLGIDVGGTFTDVVLLADGELQTAKVPTAERQEESVLAAAAAVGAVEIERFTHGTTIATDALLERRGARTAFVTTAGFEHLLHLRRQTRAHLYRPCAPHPERSWRSSAARRAGADLAGRRRRAARPRVAPGACRSRGDRRLPPLCVPGRIARARGGREAPAPSPRPGCPSRS